MTGDNLLIKAEHHNYSSKLGVAADPDIIIII